MTDSRLARPLRLGLDSFGCWRRWRALAAGTVVASLLVGQPAAALAQWRIPQLPRLPQAAGPAAAGAGPVAQAAAATTPHPAVARIIVPEKDGQSYGSGTLVDVRDQHGLVVTNWHVVRAASAEITVVFPDGFRSPAQVVKVDADWDLAALSIARPKVAPVPISAAAPQLGEALTIAGYGSGDYRAAGGICTQYLAPSERHPYELVEVGVEARQGDSGGPIFNGRGELAGVLFGSGPGYTSGSYSGRVRQFLATVIPADDPAKLQAIAGAPATNPIAPPAGAPPNTVAPPPNPLAPPAGMVAPTAPLVASQPSAAPGVPALVPDNELFAAPAPPPTHAPPVAQPKTPPASGLARADAERSPKLTPVEEPSRGWRSADDASGALDPRTAILPHEPFAEPHELADSRLGGPALKPITPNGDEEGAVVALRPVEQPAQGPARAAIVAHAPLPPRGGERAADLKSAPSDQLLAIVWRRVGGETFYDQGKTVLAIIGLLTLVLQFWRMNRHVEVVHED